MSKKEQENKFTDGLTATEKEALSNDLELIGQVIGTHDQSIFQLIASVNAMQSLAIEKGQYTQEEILKQTEKEVKKIQEKFQAAQAQAEAAVAEAANSDSEEENSKSKSE